MSGLDTLSGTEFEGLISRLLERMGFRAEMTRASGDGGIDIVAILDQPVTGGRFLIQCKRYAPESLVGAATVREFYGALTADRRAVKGILITTSGFTAQAVEFARGLPLELIGRDQLQRLLSQHELSLHDKGDSGFALATARRWAAQLSESPPSSPERSESPAAESKDRAGLLLDLGKKTMEQGKYGEAAKLFRELTQLRPDDPEVWLHLGMCSYVLGLYDDCVASARKAIGLKSNSGEAWHWLGRGFHSLGDLDGAVDALQHALTIQPDDFTGLHELAKIHWEKGDKQRALMECEKVVKVKPQYVLGWWDLGFYRHQQGSDREALAALTEAVRIDAEFAGSWVLLFLVYKNLGDRRGMAEALTRLEQLDPVQARNLQGLLPG